jgi:hypothetical protein
MGKTVTKASQSFLYLYHYTSAENISSILASGLHPSTREPNNSKSDAQWGDGQYLTDATPEEAESVTRQQFSYALFKTPWMFKAPPASLPTIGWLKIDVTDLRVQAVASLFGQRFLGRSIFLNSSQSSLPMVSRVVATGTITFKPGPKGHR